MSIKGTPRNNPQNCCLHSNNFQGSFLQSRPDRRPKSAFYFRDTKVRTCSYVKQLPNGKLVAVPYYSKRNTHGSQSSLRKSWYSTVHSERKSEEYAGCGLNKTLSTYHPNRPRNKLRIDDYVPIYRNSSIVQFGDRSAKSNWQTTYNAYYTGKQNTVRTANPQIRAYRSRWDHKLMGRS